MASKALQKLDSFFPAKGSGGGFSPKKNTVNRKYEGAAHGRRTDGFPVNNLSANKDIGRDATLLRQRTKYLYQNTTNAKRAINAIANGMVGTGIQLTINSSDKRAEAYLRKLWLLFAEETTCDFNERLDFYGIEKLVAKTYKRDGELLILRRRVPLSENPIGIQLQALEMEFLATYLNDQRLSGGGYIMNGIEYDSRGKVKAYWLFQRHPSEWWTEPVRTLAEDVIHPLDVDYPGQNRGVPSGSATIIEEKDLDEYEDAELMGKKTQASFAMARVTLDSDKLDGNINPEDYDANEDLEKIEPGTIYRLYPGEQLQSMTPPAAAGNEDYKKGKQRSIASGYEVTYEMMTGDLSEVNFSSGRMGWIEHQRCLDHWQWMTLIPGFCKRVLKWFLEQVPLIPGSPLLRLPDDLTFAWTPPKREMLDPVKESAAKVKLLRAGLVSWTDTVKSSGDNPEEVLAQIKRDIKAFKDAGVEAEWSANLLPTPLPNK